MNQRLCSVLLLALALCGPIAAETITVEKNRLAELERQASRVPELERELSAIRAELARLKNSPTTRPPVWLPPAVEQAAAKAPPTPLLSALPPLTKDASVSVNDLLNHYAADPVAADARYAGHMFRVRGVVAQFDKALFAAPYFVIFRVPGQSLALECSIAPGDSFSKVYVTGDRERVVGERGNQRITLATIGTDVVIEGRCSGGKGGVIRFGQCKLASAP